MAEEPFLEQLLRLGGKTWPARGWKAGQQAVSDTGANLLDFATHPFDRTMSAATTAGNGMIDTVKWAGDVAEKAIAAGQQTDGEKGFVRPTDQSIASIFDAAGFATTGGFGRALVAKGAAKGGPELGSAGGKGIDVFHTSPHDFDKFDISKLGSGQGAQSYGRGIYVAESPKVSGRGGAYDHEFTRKAFGGELTLDEEFVLNSLGKGEGELDILRGLASRGGGYTFEEASALLGRVKANKAHVYEARLHASPDEFLDWDQQVKDQSSVVRDGIDRVAQKVFPGGKDFGRTEGSRVYNMLEQGLGPAMGREVYHKRAAELSSLLTSNGIKGTRYLDQGSRGGGKYTALDAKEARAYRDTLERSRVGVASSPDAPSTEALIQSRFGLSLEEMERRAKALTRNYAVHDDSIIELLRKYGLAGTAGGAAGAGALSTSGGEAKAESVSDAFSRYRKPGQ